MESEVRDSQLWLTGPMGFIVHELYVDMTGDLSNTEYRRSKVSELKSKIDRVITHSEAKTTLNGHIASFTNADTLERKEVFKNPVRKITYPGGAVYEGMCRPGTDIREGYGKYIWASGSIYEGEYKDDEINGKGKLIWARGDTYEGEWKDNKRHGKGKMINADGTIYEGDWKDDKINGVGKYIGADGAIYEGEHKDDKRNGVGKYIFANGYILEGVWKDDNFVG
jgi:hypothetical protein